MGAKSSGFSLIELILALTMSLGIGMIVLQMFHQNERVFRDQSLILETQQSARVVISQIADELRMAGQGMPMYASTSDLDSTEATAVILAGSGSSRINFRAGLSSIETTVTAAMPVDFVIGDSRTVSVGAATPFQIGKFVYVTGPGENDTWAWMRAEILQTNAAAKTLTLIPRHAMNVRFIDRPIVSLDEAVSFFIASGSIKRATASNLSDQTNPVWSASSEIGRNFRSLQFTYFDKDNTSVTPQSLAERLSISRIDVRVVAETSQTLTRGGRQEFALTMRTIPRNVQIR